MKTFLIQIQIAGADHVADEELRAALQMTLDGSTAREAMEVANFSRFADDAPDIRISGLRVLEETPAAADLLEALRDLEAIGHGGVIERRETGKPTWHALNAVKSIARAAIAKYEGAAP